eukprot:4603471-Pleurochrysis_carterae.AAC.2
MQMQFDGMSWTRGRGCTRMSVRCIDLKIGYNSPFLLARHLVLHRQRQVQGPQRELSSWRQTDVHSPSSPIVITLLLLE